jgi:hypothetical protein
MSYDISLFLPVPGESPLTTAQRDQDFQRPLSESGRVRNERLAEALRRVVPSVEVVEKDNETEFVIDEFGIQIFVSEQEGSINIPYWSGNESERVFELIDSLLLAIREQTGMLAFDRQSEQILDANQKPGVNRTMFSIGVDVVDNLEKRKPWWRIW